MLTPVRLPKLLDEGMSGKLREDCALTDGWSPGEGERVYIAQEYLSGYIVGCQGGGDDVVYLVELDSAAGATTAKQSHQWGYDPAETRWCTIEDLAPG